MQYNCKTKKGHGRGADLGFRTINCEIPPEITEDHGIYAGYTHIDQKRYPSAIHFGPIPAFQQIEPSLEAHLIDATLNTQPESIQIELLQKIRPIQDFKTSEELTAQISNDVEQIKSLLTS